MKKTWNTFRKFWSAEEVPRWFGLSLILIYLCGLGGVFFFGMHEARREASRLRDEAVAYAVTSLGERLSQISQHTTDSAAEARAYHRLLCEFGANLPVQLLQVVDQHGVIFASLRPGEAGERSSREWAPPDAAAGPGALHVSTSHDGREHHYRVDISPSGRHWATSDEPSRAESAMTPARALIASIPMNGEHSSPGVSANALTIVLLVLGALFALYRRLRAQLRGVSQIADRLRDSRDRIEENLSSLRVADTMDNVTTAWNSLIESAQGWHESVQRTQANDELSRVLLKSGGGALPEALHALPDGVILITHEVRFEYLNARALRLMGWSAEQSREFTLPTAIAGGVGEKILSAIRGTVRPGGSFEGRTEQIEFGGENGRDGSSFRAWIIPLQRPRQSGECLVIIRDVSQLVRADRAREDFVTQVTHELRTPLTNIRAYAETLSSGMFDDPKVITECYNVITKETRRLSRLIEDILSVSQLEVGSIELALDQVDLRTLLTDAVRDVRGLADEKNIDLQLLLPSKLEAVRADRDKLSVVINNLLGNAIKYTPSGGNVIVGCQIGGDAVVLTFKDNGIGIDPSDHSRIFEKFQRANDEAVLQETGTGIGLYTAREIVRRHGGDIEVLSAKGQGSTFLVRLPHQASRAGALTPTQEN